jgi:urease accessory protein
MRTRITTELRDGRPAAVALSGSALRPRLLAPRDGPLRVALVQAHAGLLAGDHLTIEVTVGAGTSLELVEPAATVAHDARGGPVARWTAEIELERGARLIWLAAPFIVAGGARVRRCLRAELAEDSAMLARETLVLGRAGERAGRAVSETSVRYAGRPLLEELLHTATARSPVVAGSAAKALDTLMLLGLRPPPAPGTWPLHGPGAVRSFPAASCAEAEAAARGVIGDWRALTAAPPALVLAGVS